MIAALRGFYIVFMLGLMIVFGRPFPAGAEDVTLAWDANSETDLNGYMVYYGTASRNYPHRFDVGNTTRYSLSGLTEGMIYYFAVTAYDTDGNESAYSTELVYAVPSADSDGDGLTDSQESQQYGTDPLEADTDADGMDDGWEVSYGTDPLGFDADQDIDADGIVNLDEYRAWIQNGNLPPDAPVLLEPAAGATGVETAPTLTVDAFYDPNPSDRHAATHWQIAQSDDFSELVFDLRSDAHLLRLPLPVLVLAQGRAYWWRVKVVDNHGGDSQWSTIATFETASHAFDDHNANGIPEPQEVDPVIDLDVNGTPDYMQTDLKCVAAASGTMQIAVQCPEADGVLDVLQSLSAGVDTTRALSSIRLPVGLIGFRISVPDIGSTVAVKIYFSEALPAGSQWYKYNRLSGWEDYGNHVVFSGDRQRVTVSLQDGGFGDADGIANGVIVDPSGPVAFSVADSDSNQVIGGGGGGGGCFIDASRRRCVPPNDSAGWGRQMLNFIKWWDK